MNKRKQKKSKLTPLVVRAKAGDQAALEELLERLKPLVLKYARRMRVSYREEAKSELLLQLIKAIENFEPGTDWGKKELLKHINKNKEYE
jgi:DNA-directed RNA polymerase specialized sigma24 family protein